MKLITTKQFNPEAEGIRQEYVRQLENLVISYNTALLQGYTCVTDVIYNSSIELIELLNPTSPLLRNNREVTYIKDFTPEVREFLETSLQDEDDTLKFLLNPQGLNARLYYANGDLLKAESFGRSLLGTDITDLVKAIIGDRNENLADVSSVAVEGVFVLPFSNIELAEEYFNILDPYQGVFTIATSDMQDKDELIHYIATDIFTEEFDFASVQDKYAYLESLEFLTPECFEIPRSADIIADIDSALYQVETEFSDYDYMTDALRFLVLDANVILIKMGKWRPQIFQGTVVDVTWVDDQGMKLPFVQFLDPVRLDDTSKVDGIKLQAVNMLLILDVQIGEPLQFISLGAFGLTPVTKNFEVILN